MTTAASATAAMPVRPAASPQRAAPSKIPVEQPFERTLDQATAPRPTNKTRGARPAGGKKDNADEPATSADRSAPARDADPAARADQESDQVDRAAPADGDPPDKAAPEPQEHPTDVTQQNNTAAAAPVAVAATAASAVTGTAPASAANSAPAAGLDAAASEAPAVAGTADAATAQIGTPLLASLPAGSANTRHSKLASNDGPADGEKGGNLAAKGAKTSAAASDAAAQPTGAQGAAQHQGSEAAIPAAQASGDLPGVLPGALPGGAATIARQPAEVGGASLLIGTSDSPPDAQQANVARVVRGLYAAASAGGGVVTLRLSPPEMGLVRVELQMQQGLVRAKLLAQQDTARDLLGQRVGELRLALERQGLVVERLHVESLPAQPTGSPTPQDARGQSRQQAEQGWQGQGGSQQPPQERGRGGRSFEAELLDMVA